MEVTFEGQDQHCPYSDSDPKSPSTLHLPREEHDGCQYSKIDSNNHNISLLQRDEYGECACVEGDLVGIMRSIPLVFCSYRSHTS